MPIKVTALMSPAVLEQLTEFIAADSNSINSNSRSAKTVQEEEVALIARLSSEQQELYHTAMVHLSDLCAHAQSKQVALLFDAEQTHRQPVIGVCACV